MQKEQMRAGDPDFGANLINIKKQQLREKPSAA